MTGRRAIIHIGAPRTGTTTLQTLLNRHRTALLAADVLYPSLTPGSAREPHINHQHFGETLDGRRPRGERRELLDALDRQLAGSHADVLILSYERLSVLPRWRNVPATLAALLARHGFAMEILLTVRPQAGAAQSRYTWRCQFLREARTFAERFAHDIDDPWLAASAGLAAWLPAAAGRVSAVPLKDARLTTPLAARVVDALGLTERIGALLSDQDLAQAENRSLGAATVEASRRLSAGGATLRDNGAARRVVDFLDAELARHGLAAERFQGLDAAMLARAEERFARANERFARRVWGVPWAARVAPDRAAPLTEFARRATPVPPSVEATLVNVCRAARERFAFDRTPWPLSAMRVLARLGRG